MKTIRLWIWSACFFACLTVHAQVTQQVTAIQYYFNTDPGVGVAGNGAIIPVTPTSNFNQTLSLTLPGSLGPGIHQLYLRVKDEYRRWSATERRLFYVTQLAAGTRNLTGYQWYLDTDPGVGIAGNGAVVPITSTSSFNSTIAISLPAALSSGIHLLYIRTRDDAGRWSIAERRIIYISDIVNGTRNIVAYQWFVDNDPGIGVAGSGAIVPVSSTASFNSTIALSLPTLSNGFHQLYIRAKDDKGRWSLAERKLFMVSPIIAQTRNLVAYQWFVDTDPGPGVAGSQGAVVPFASTANFSQTVAINLPGALSRGIHQLYIRTKDDLNHWSIAERKMFYISDVVPSTNDLVKLEYYFDNDPGMGNANPYNITSTSELNSTVMLGVPCLSSGTHYLYIRAKDTKGRWSIIGRDTLTVTGSIQPAVVSPAGPINFCAGSNVVLSTLAVPGVTYQWVKNGVPVSGETNPSITVTTDGQYAIRSICSSVFSLSNTVTVTVQAQVTYYADADSDGYGNPSVTLAACVQPAGYVINNTDCNDGNMNIHPGATETCNLIDDDCDGSVDEGVQTTFYADADGDGYGNPSITTLACSTPIGYVTNGNDCNDANNAIHPGATEICNLIDDNCNGTVDEGVQTTFYADADGDGYGNAAVPLMACSLPAGYVSNNNDCNDANNAIHPGATESCNSADDNCDGSIDEGFTASIAAASINSSAGNTFCAGISTTLTTVGGSLGSGATWKWYENACSGTPIGSGSSLVITPTAGSHTYYVRAEGACNSTVCASLTIMVNSSPVFNSCPSNMVTDNASANCGKEITYSVSSSGSPAPTFAYSFEGETVGAGSGTGSGTTFDVGTTEVTIVASNTCGTDDCNFSITVQDNEAPVIINCPADIQSVHEEGQWGAHVTWSEPLVNDNCEVASLTSTHAPGDFFVVGNTLVTYTATDIHGNSRTCAFIVTVQEPDVIGPVNVSIFADDISFSDMTPDTGDVIEIYALVHNTSAEDAGSFACRLINQYDGTVYADTLLDGLAAGQTVLISWSIETPALPAFVPMEVVIDQFDQLDESNEFDNSAIRPFINGAFALDASIVVTAYPESNSVPAGSTIQLCGDAEYDDTALPLNDYSVAGARVTIEIIETGQMLTGTTNADGHFCIGYQVPVTPGQLSFVAEVTDFTLTGRSDTNTFNITVPVITCPTDLDVGLQIVGDFLCGNQNHIAAGSSVNGVVTVRNNCSAVTTATTLYITAPEATPSSTVFEVPPLLPAQQVSFTLPVFTFNTAGSAHLTAIADYYNVISEVNEGNNATTQYLIVHPALPDIEPTGAVVNSSWLCQANQVTVSIANTGGAATGPFEANVDILENGLVIASYLEEVENIDPLCNLNLYYAFLPASGNTYTVEVTCDAADGVPELSESNNAMQRDLFLTACSPDLVIYGCGALDVKPAYPAYPGTMTVSAVIGNAGTEAITSPFDVRFDVAGNIYTYRFLDMLERNELKTILISIPTPPPGGSLLTITVDALDEIAEKSETNNSLDGSNQKLCVDFEVTNERCEGTAIPGTQSICRAATIGVAVRNVYLYEASSLTLRFEISGPGLPPGWNLLGNITRYMGNTCDCPAYFTLPGAYYYPTTGLYTIRVTADPGNVYSECAEDNNVLLATVQVVEAADYATYSEYIAPSQLNPEINEPISFILTYENSGCTGEEPLELMLQIDNTPFDSLQAGPLNENTFNSYPFPGTWSSGLAGLHIIRAFTDHDDVIQEIDETNNEATRAVIVGTAPDLHVIGISPSTYNPSQGNTMQLTALVTNEGGTGVNGLMRFYYRTSDGTEHPITAKPVFVMVDDTIETTVPWETVDPHATLLVRATDADPVEYDFTDNEAVVQLNPLSLDLHITDNACYSLDEGTIEVDPIGGKPPYFIQWSNGRNDTLIEVPAGIYTVTVTDDNGSVSTAQGEIVVLGYPEMRYRDNDGDGFGQAALHILSCDVVPGYVSNADDCDDTDVAIHPGAQEICNNLDDDCDGLIDDADESIAGQLTWYYDGDNDGYGRADSTQLACSEPGGYSGNGNDCDDTRSTVYPGAPEILDNRDNDCDGLIDEGLSSLTVEAGGCETVFFGYSPESCQVLAVFASGGTTPYTYLWSNGATTSTTTVCPNTTTTYSVTVTDHNGYIASDNVTVQVIDVSCGNNGNKVIVCHIPPGNPNNPQIICIASSAIPAHLAHGCYVGVCGAVDPCEGSNEGIVSDHSLSIPVTEANDQQTSTTAYDSTLINHRVSLNPSIANDFANIEVEGITSRYQIRVFDSSGKWIMDATAAEPDYRLETSGFRNGVYFIHIITPAFKTTLSMVVLH